jgi:hypothetical protein
LIQPAYVPTAHRRCDVLRCIAQINRVNFSISLRAQQAGAQRQYTTAVCGRAFWEDADDAARVRVDQGGEGDELRLIRWRDGGRGEGEENCTEESDAFDFATVWVGAREDGLEDASEVERVERRCEGGGDDSACFRQVFFCC